MIRFTFNSRGNAKLFPKAAAPFYIHANNICEGFNFFTSWQTLAAFRFCLFALYYYSYSSVFVCFCISLMANDVGYLFLCFLPICLSSLEDPLPFHSAAGGVYSPNVLHLDEVAFICTGCLCFCYDLKKSCCLI